MKLIFWIAFGGYSLILIPPLVVENFGYDFDWSVFDFVPDVLIHSAVLISCIGSCFGLIQNLFGFLCDAKKAVVKFAEVMILLGKRIMLKEASNFPDKMKYTDDFKSLSISGLKTLGWIVVFWFTADSQLPCVSDGHGEIYLLKFDLLLVEAVVGALLWQLFLAVLCILIIGFLIEGTRSLEDFFIEFIKEEENAMALFKSGICLVPEELKTKYYDQSFHYYVEYINGKERKGARFFYFSRIISRIIWLNILLLTFLFYKPPLKPIDVS